FRWIRPVISCSFNAMRSALAALISTTLQLLELLMGDYGPPVERQRVILSMFQSCTSARTYPAVFLAPPLDSWHLTPTLARMLIVRRGGIAALAASVLGSITVRAHNMDGYGSECTGRRNTVSKWCLTLMPTPVNR